MFTYKIAKTNQTKIELDCEEICVSFGVSVHCPAKRQFAEVSYWGCLLLVPGQRVESTKREMFSQKSVRRFVGDSLAFVMGAMLLASALNRSISPRY